MGATREVKQDPETYMRLIKPRPREEVAAALAAFMDDLYALRVKHGICDVGVIAGASVDTGEPNPDGMMTMARVCGHFGNSTNALPMAAMLFRYHHEEAKAALDAEALEMAGIQPKTDTDEKGEPR